MAITCNVCKKTISKKSAGLQCTGTCGEEFHPRCAGFTIDQYKTLQDDTFGVESKCICCRRKTIDALNRSDAEIKETPVTINVLRDIQHK